MRIIGIEGMTGEQVMQELQRGGRFVIYKYCISIIVMTFQQPSNIYFIRAGEGAVGKGIGFTLLSLFLGWWGIPWGPIYTIGALITNFSGGEDVTQSVLASFHGQGST